VATVTDTIKYVVTVYEPGGCWDKDSLTLTVHPDRGLDAGIDTTVAPGQTINLFAAGGPYSTYDWQPDDALSDPSGQSPSFTVSVPVTYTVTATTEFGCEEKDSITISVATGLNIYTGFTPNDDGRNDFWDIDFVEYYPNITVSIYDRWGKQIFYSKGYSDEKRWDGKFNGKDLPIGTYYYIINLNDGSPLLKGPVTIVR
jgi:gliding motility-associated-like protein